MTRRKWLNLLSYAVAVILLIVVVRCFMRREQWSLLAGLPPWSVAAALLLAIPAYIGNGLEYYLLRDHFGFPMEKKDIVLLPLAMNLWGMLLPVQGAMIYASCYLKRKYEVSISRSLAISLFLYLITVFLSGVFGLLFAVFYHVSSWWFVGISLVFLISPLLLWAAWKLCRVLPVPKFLRPAADFLFGTLEDMVVLLRQRRLTALLVLVYVLRFIAFIVLYAWMAHSLGYDHVSWVALFLLNLWNLLSLLVKFTPNNLGVMQLVSGLLFAVIGLKVEDGVVISLAVNVVFTVVGLTAGAAAWLWAEHSIKIRRAESGNL